MREGFDNVAGHPEATLENPYVSIIGLDDLDELPISRANWRLYEGAYIDGAVGMHNRFVGEDLYNGQLVSPTMVPGASDRVVTVSADFASATRRAPSSSFIALCRIRRRGRHRGRWWTERDFRHNEGFRQAHRAAEGHFVALHPQHIA